MTQTKVKKLLKKIKGKDLSSFGVRAESTLNYMKKSKEINKKNLKFIEEAI